jgi:glycosyltransferase involved in cell wall biosynthesis
MRAGKATSENNRPIISVITVCRNAELTLLQTIKSMAAQTDRRFEYILVDGQSTDGTLKIVEAYGEHIDTWVSEADSGIYDAMNKGARLAKGEYLAFLNADDRYFPDTIETVIKHIEQSNAAVYHGNMVKERILQGKIYTREERPTPEIMRHGMGIFHPSSFVNASLFRDMKGFDTRYRLAADYDFFLRLWQSGASFHHIDQALSVFSLAGVSNASCNTYAEAIKIQKRNKTGTAVSTIGLLWKCRSKRALRKVTFGLADVLGLQGIVRSRQLKKWQ